MEVSLLLDEFAARIASERGQVNGQVETRIHTSRNRLITLMADAIGALPSIEAFENNPTQDTVVRSLNP
jgi:hypothetical protein